MMLTPEQLKDLSCYEDGIGFGTCPGCGRTPAYDAKIYHLLNGEPIHQKCAHEALDIRFECKECKGEGTYEYKHSEEKFDCPTCKGKGFTHVEPRVSKNSCSE